MHRAQILSSSDSAITQVLQLGAGEQAESTTPATGQVPTHLLWQDKAYAISRGLKLPVDLSTGPLGGGETACSIYVRNGELILEQDGSQQLTINGNATENTKILRSGDVLNLGNHQLTLITVLTNG